MLKPTSQVVNALLTCSQPHALLRMGPNPKLLESRSQLRLRNTRPTFFLDRWDASTQDDFFLKEIELLLRPIGVDVYVVGTTWANFLSNCNSRTTVHVEDDGHIQACTNSDDALHDRHIETVQALLHANLPQVAIISEPYGFGKTRVTAVAACCRFPNRTIVMIVDVPNELFAMGEAKHTTATVVQYDGSAKSKDAINSTTGTVLVVVKRTMVGDLAANMTRSAAVVIIDEAYRNFNKGFEPQYVLNAQKIADVNTYWWITDAFITARSAGQNNDVTRRNWLWEQINRFRTIAGLWNLPRHCPRALVQEHVVQHADSVMDELAGSMNGWSLFPSANPPSYQSEAEFTQAKAAMLVEHIYEFFDQKPKMPRRVVMMGSFSNKLYVQSDERARIIAAFSACNGVEVFEQTYTPDRIAKFNAATPSAGNVALIFVSRPTMKQVTLKASLMVCVGDANYLSDSLHSFADGVVRRRERFAVLKSIEGRIRRCQSNPSEKFYRYLFKYKKSEPEPAAKRRKIGGK